LAPQRGAILLDRQRVFVDRLGYRVDMAPENILHSAHRALTYIEVFHSLLSISFFLRDPLHLVSAPRDVPSAIAVDCACNFSAKYCQNTRKKQKKGGNQPNKEMRL
jgi:hypothetical protein